MKKLPKIETPTYITELPSSGKKVKYRPFLIKEEKILLIASESKDTAQIIENVNSVLKNCILSEDVNVEELPSYDAQWLFLKLREVSISNTVNARIKCPVTNKYFENDLLLSKAQVVKDPERTNKIILEDGVGMIFRDLTLKDVFCDEILNNMDSYDAILLLISKCVTEIFDKKNVYDAKEFSQEDLKAFLESLRKEHFEKITDYFDKLPKIKLEDEVFSPYANQTIKVSIDNFMDFFG